MPYKRRGYGRYRQTKFSGGKRKNYVNLKVFNSECGARGVRGNVCELKTLKNTRDGCVAHVRSEKGAIKGKPTGTWKLRFASCEVFKMHVGKRVLDPKGLLKR